MAGQGEDIPQALGDLFSQILDLHSGDVGTEELQARLTTGALKILALKAAHRAACEDTEALREATADAKARLDASSLHLQSLLYEKHHYEKEIQSCTSFRSAYPADRLELLPEDDYLAAKAAEGGTGGDATEVEGASAAADPHQRMLDRLQHELAFRQATLKDLEALKARREALAADVASRRAACAGLEAEVARLRSAAQRVAKAFNVDAPGLGEIDRLAALLPPPLYILLVTLRAAAAAEGLPLQVSVAGEAADALHKQVNAAMVRSPSTPANVAEAALARAAAGAAAAGAGAPFPLAVEAAVMRQNEAETAFKATFSFIPSLNVVTVAASGGAAGAAKMEDLFGEEGAGVAMAAAGADEKTLPGKAYAWAQRAAGLDLLPPLPELLARGGGSGGPEALAALATYQNERRATVLAEKLVLAAGL